MDSILTQILRPMLAERYPDRGVYFPADTGVIAVIPPCHAEFGELRLFDEGREVTLFLGNFTHSHFGCYEADFSEVQRAESIAEDVTAFLDALFSDQVECYGSHSGIGGWKRMDLGEGGTFRRLAGSTAYVWSGPI